MATSDSDLSVSNPAPAGVRSIEDAPEGRTVAAFVFVNLLLRVALLPLNPGDYTDGVLQVTQGRESAALWPPLYGWIAGAVAQTMPVLYAGRLVSAVAGALGLIPLWLLARRTGGRRAAFFTALLYTVAPVSLRWSAHMMSDMLFAALFWAAVERWEAAGRRSRRMENKEWRMETGGSTAAELGKTPEDTDKPRLGHGEIFVAKFPPRDGPLAAATLFTAAATLTRYQGILLLPLIAWSWMSAAWISVRNSRTVAASEVSGETRHPSRISFPWRTLLAALTLLVVPLWIRLAGVAHGQQFSERLGGSLANALTVISVNGEAFLLLTPYFLTYPAALCVAYGLLRGAGKPARPLLAATIYLGVVLLLLQAAFSSFQERYLMPWLGLLWVWGGIGLSVLRDSLEKRLRWFSAVLAVVVIWSALVSLAVLVLQRQAFADFAAAGQWLRENATPDAVIYSTEVYNPQLGGKVIATNKIRFFSGRDVNWLPPPAFESPNPPDLPPGSLVCLHSSYPTWSQEMLVRAYRARQVFDSNTLLLPLFPDIMERPGVAQNPTAWFYRYEPQHFWTSIWRIDENRKRPEPDPGSPTP